MRSLGWVLVAAMSFVATTAHAGDGNQAYLLQKSPEGTLNGNTLTILQDEADDSLVRGIGPSLIGHLPSYILMQISGSDPLAAKQQGEGNSARLELRGSGGELQLLQSAAPWTPWVPGGAAGGNVAEIVASGNALGGIIQIGELNQAGMLLEGDDARGLITQLGSSLTAELEVGPGASGTVIQLGRNSDAGTVQVETGTTLTYTQIGSNLRPNQALVQVFSTAPGNITITQTAF